MMSFVVAALCVQIGSACAPAQETDLWLRVGWGGGAGRQWNGSVRVQGGNVTDFRAVGLTPDSPGSMFIRDGELRIQQRGPHSYEVVDVRVEAQLESKLILNLAPQDAARSSRRIELNLADILAIEKSFSADLDDTKNQILVHRVPGDHLRVEFDRPSLVFSPGEEFQFRVLPVSAGTAPSTNYRCEVQLLSMGRELWREDRELPVDASGRAPPLDLYRVRLPNVEGVYEIAISISQRRLSVPLFRSAPVATRRVQLVVVSNEPGATSEEDIWRTEQEYDIANNPRVLDRLKRLATPRLIGTGQEPLSNKLSRVVDRTGEKMTLLEPGGWIAIPLTIARLGELHRIEIAFPTDQEQSLAISIVEPDAAGQLPNFGIDSGVEVPDVKATALVPIETHRIPFWPKTKTPYVVLFNRQSKTPAAFGKIRLQTGPKTLPNLFKNFPREGRSLALVLDRPWFPENFGAPKAMDPEGQSALPDWSTFLDGANRLVQYVHYMGYDTVILSVVHEGCAIYPSTVLEPSTTYDRGVYFQSGQDPVRKDVVELLFRIFDREGIRFFPAIQFSSPLPELEAQLREGPASSAGIPLIGDDGRAWHQRHGTLRGTAPYYNILNRSVQCSMQRVVQEVVDRYQHHPAFAGIGIQLGPQTFAQLPEEDWGLDDETMQAFIQAKLPGTAKINMTDTGPERFAVRAQSLRESSKPAWMTWRAQTVADFYQQLAQELSRSRPDAQLMLCSHDLYQPIALTDGGAFLNRFTQSRLRPSLTAARRRGLLFDASLRVGLDPSLFSNSPNLLFPRPLRVASANSIWEQGASYELARSTEADNLFQRNGTAVLIFQDAQVLSLPDFDKQNPFGASAGRLRMIAQEVPASCYRRRWLVHSLAVHDPNQIMSGGWLAPFGQEDAWRNFVRVFRQLPTEPMKIVEPQKEDSPLKGITIRLGGSKGRTAVAVINDAPWPNRVTIDFAPADRGRFFAVGGDYSESAQPQASFRGPVRSITVDLEAYDVVGLFADVQVSIVDWRASPPPSVEIELSHQIADIRTRMGGLNRIEPMANLKNPGFEEGTNQAKLPGWEFARGEAIDVSIDRQSPANGQHSLHLGAWRPQTVAWIRSEPLPIPSTGRISVEAQLRTRDAARQPALRMAIEGHVHDRPYFRFARLGRLEDNLPPSAANEKVTRLGTDWGRFQFHVDDLPTAGISELRIVFELSGNGEVWLDDVAVYDKLFQKNEVNELVKLAAIAETSLQQGKLTDCEKFLDSYWSRFLLEHIPLPAPPRVAQRTATLTTAPAPQKVPESNTPKSEEFNWMRLVPKVKIPLQRR